MRAFFSIFSTVLLSGLLFAEVRLPAIFGDHMVLQQETGAPIWGWAEPGESISVSGSWGEKAAVSTDANGKWMAFLDTPSHGGPYSVEIRGENLIKLENVLIGEVWLCAGQSNMGWRLSATMHGPEAAKAADFPDIRIFRSERAHSHKPQEDVVAEWKVCNPDSAATCSAVTFYFARKLHQELGIPIGVVLQPYAGTPIEGWMPKEIQLGDPRTWRAIQEADAESAKYDLAKAQAQLERATEAWKRGERRAQPKLRTPTNWGHQYPGNIFNGMIHPVRPFGIRGAIWYQGERNAKDVAQAANYERQLSLLIDYYRSSWFDLSRGKVAKDFPFYFVQLPSWLAEQSEPVEHDAAWAVSRDMMRRVANAVPNTGTAVSLDTGDAILLHPTDKKPIGIRLAYLALKRTYGKSLVEQGPNYRSMERVGNKILLTFDSVGTGLVTGRSGPLDSFAIAGQDRKFVWADASIEGDAVVVSAEGISEPEAVRYAWAMNPSRRNLLYNREGLPASPFRTDDWELYDPENYTPAPQDKPVKPDGYVQAEVRLPEMMQ